MRHQLLGTARRFGVGVAAVAVTTALAAAAPFPAPAAVSGPSERPSALVDPLIGSSNGGNTYPGATLPYGMIAWSPTSTTGDQTSTGAANGYEYGATRIRGLSLTHVNGAGCNPGAAGDVPIMPFVGDVTSSPSADTKDAVYASNFSHADEKATPAATPSASPPAPPPTSPSASAPESPTSPSPPTARRACSSASPTPSTAARMRTSTSTPSTRR